MESEVSKNAYAGMKIDSVLATIKQYEDRLRTRVEHKTA